MGEGVSMKFIFGILVVISIVIILAIPSAAVILVPACIIFFFVAGKKKKAGGDEKKGQEEPEDDRTVILNHMSGMEDEKTTFMWEQEGIKGLVALMDMGEGGAVFRKMIDSEIVVGKDESCCDVCIRYDKTVSKKHCRIRRWGNEFFISDEGSSNGTYVNGKKITVEPAGLVTDDVIKLGRTQLKFQILE